MRWRTTPTLRSCRDSTLSDRRSSIVGPGESIACGAARDLRGRHRRRVRRRRRSGSPEPHPARRLRTIAIEPGDIPRPQLGSHDTGPDATLLPIARSAVDLLTGKDLARLHRCANDRCVLLFYDTTKSATRRWCSIACMNRARSSRRYRERKQGVSVPVARWLRRPAATNAGRLTKRLSRCPGRPRRSHSAVSSPSSRISSTQVAGRLLNTSDTVA